jgi:PTS system nitrogen regulatory IIA component
VKITDFLDIRSVMTELQGDNKNSVLREMAGNLSVQFASVNPEQILSVLLEREKLGSTAIGEGVAIPHGKLPGIGQVHGLFARSSGGIDFDSIDGGPTHLFFVLIAPENSAGDHLKALARISRLLKDSEFRARLMKAKSKEEIFATIKEEDEKF